MSRAHTVLSAKVERFLKSEKALLPDINKLHLSAIVNENLLSQFVVYGNAQTFHNTQYIHVQNAS
jgi:hypothetical protein